MSKKEISDKKLEILFHMHDIQNAELNFRRTREFRIFQWSGSIFIAIIGILIAIDQSKTILWETYGIVGKTITTVTIVIFVIFSIIWQNRERKFGSEHKKIIARINKILFVFDEGNFGLDKDESLYPNNERWKNWGTTKIVSKNRYFRGNFLTATWLLGALAIAMIWLS